MEKKKHRQNFTINEKTSEEFKKVCDHMSINMSKLIENYMEEYIEQNSIEIKLNDVINNLVSIKITASNNYELNEYGYKCPLRLADIMELTDNDEFKANWKIITKIIMCSNLIATGLRCGPANVCIMNEENYNMLSACIKSEKNGKFIGGIEVVVNNIIGNFILCLRLLSESDINLILQLDGNTDISKQYVGFELIK
jgi:hypothetical protein